VTKKKCFYNNDTSVEVLITVTDENDNSPVFYPRIYFVALPNVGRRNGVPLVVVKAFDDDVAENSRLKFAIENSGEVPGAKIGEDSGEVFLERPVPADKVLKISATDAGGRRSR
jgi:hypothetical protein